MTNTITVDQLKQLLQIQKDFDSRIPTLNLQDSKVAYVVEFFEWFNTLETFKNWKKNPGKPLDVQLDELADMLAFGLSIANQMGIDDEHINGFVNESEPDDLVDIDVIFNDKTDSKKYILQLVEYSLKYGDCLHFISLPYVVAVKIYSIDQLIKAYKKKMTHNHLRQDGAVDTDKGYV